VSSVRLVGTWQRETVSSALLWKKTRTGPANNLRCPLMPLSGDAEPFHLPSQRGALHPQAGGRPFRAAQHPAGFADNVEDVLPFGVGQGTSCGPGQVQWLLCEFDRLRPVVDVQVVAIQQQRSQQRIVPIAGGD